MKAYRTIHKVEVRVETQLYISMLIYIYIHMNPSCWSDSSACSSRWMSVNGNDINQAKHENTKWSFFFFFFIYASANVTCTTHQKPHSFITFYFHSISLWRALLSHVHSVPTYRTLNKFPIFYNTIQVKKHPWLSVKISFKFLHYYQ